MLGSPCAATSVAAMRRLREILPVGDKAAADFDGLLPPVLKHGPRSLPFGRTLECKTQQGEMKVATRESVKDATGHGSDQLKGI